MCSEAMGASSWIPGFVVVALSKSFSSFEALLVLNRIEDDQSMPIDLRIT